MPSLEEIRIKIDEYESPALQADGFDDCILGAGPLGPDNEYILVYSEQKIINKLMSQGMSYLDALEHYSYNIEDAYVGPGTPVFIDEVEQE